jgi:hypothetical protein
MLYAFFWAIPRRLNFICRRFWTPCLFYLHTYPPTKMGGSVPKRRHVKFRRRWITQKKAYNIQNTMKVWNQEFLRQEYRFIRNSEINIRHKKLGLWSVLMKFKTNILYSRIQTSYISVNFKDHFQNWTMNRLIHRSPHALPLTLEYGH